MSHSAWEVWIDRGLQNIQEQKLERVLRPLFPTSSPVEAYIHAAELHAWLDGKPSPDSLKGTALSPYQQQQQQQSQTAGWSQVACRQQLPLSQGVDAFEVPMARHAGQISPSPKQQQQQQQQRQQSQTDHPQNQDCGAASFRRLVLFSLNDYLGLSSHPDVRAAAAAAAQQVGNGPRSSALVGGFTHLHRQLEVSLARLKGTQDALLFPTGFAANTAVVSVLAAASSSPQKHHQQQGCAPEVVIFSDELNHASIIDGARLASRGSGVAVQVYRHNDMSHLEQQLAAAPASARKLVVTDSLFSMDGDYADLLGLVALRAKYGFLLVVDEAHATLVAGRHGGGAAEAAGVCEHIDVHTGTLSKAVGALGGFVACSRQLRALLLNKGRSVVYSTALPVPVVAAAQAALEVAARETWRQQHLHDLMALVQARLGVPAVSPIIPLVVGSEATALHLSRQLLSAGFHVPAIRPPTVPEGTSRLRVSLSAGHSVAQVEALCDAVQEALGQMVGVRLHSLPHLEQWQQQQQQQQSSPQKQQCSVVTTPSSQMAASVSSNYSPAVCVDGVPTQERLHSKL